MTDVYTTTNTNATPVSMKSFAEMARKLGLDDFPKPVHFLLTPQQWESLKARIAHRVYFRPDHPPRIDFSGVPVEVIADREQWRRHVKALKDFKHEVRVVAPSTLDEPYPLEPPTMLDGFTS